MEDVEIEIPSHFLCPISLQLMLDPVIVATGITYDRDSIERWLQSTTTTAVCPVTKQPLQSTSDLTPNHNLRRLIQSWCTLHAADGVERIPTPKPPVDHSTVSKLLSTATRSQDHLTKSLLRLNSIAIRGADRDRLALRSSGAVPFLASLLTTTNLVSASASQSASVYARPAVVSEPPISASVLTNIALETLAQIDASDDELRSTMIGAKAEVLVDKLTTFLSFGDSQSRFYAVKVLLSLYTTADPNQLMSVNSRLFYETVRLIRDQVSTQGTKFGLKLLIELNPWGRNRIKAVDAGATEALIEMLLEGPEKRVCELAMVVLDQLCGCAEGRAGLLGHAAGVAVVSKKILRVSNMVSDRGVRILASVSRYSANGVLLGEMVQVGVVAKLCLVLQVDCSLKAKERAKEILRAHSRVWKSSSCIPPHLLRSYPSN